MLVPGARQARRKTLVVPPATVISSTVMDTGLIVVLVTGRERHPVKVISRICHTSPTTKCHIDVTSLFIHIRL